MKEFRNLNSLYKSYNRKIWALISIAIALLISYFVINFMVVDRTYYKFDIGEEQFKISLPSNNSFAESYSNKPRTFTYSGDLPYDWEKDFWNIFLIDSASDNLLKEYIEQITSISPNFSNNQVEILIAFVQGSIEYDHTKAESGNSSLQYPIETLYRKKGVCSDKSILLAKLLILLDYKVVLFSFPKMNHMAIGISVPKGFDNFNSGYCFIETTAYSLIGRIPEKIHGEIFNEQPDLIFPQINGKKSYYEISNIVAKYSFFEKKYGTNYLLSSAYKKGLLKKMKLKNDIIDSLKLKYKANCSGTLPKGKYNTCIQLNKQINNETSEYNDLVKLFNEKTE